jgi:hypothetical protein
LLHKRGEHGEARRHALLALEEAPRYRSALQLLLEIRRATDVPSREAAPAGQPTPPSKTE